MTSTAHIGLTLGHLGRSRTTPECALSLFTSVEGLRAVVFGHSHVPYNGVQRGVLLFNPGSPTERRYQPRPSYGFLTVENCLVRGDIAYI